MTISNLRRVGTAVAGSTAIVAPAAFFATPAFSVSTSCGGVAGAVEVHDGVCEYVYDTPGEYTFEAPAGVAKIAAVVVGGGGGGYFFVDDKSGSGGNLYQEAYGGGGGDVTMTEIEAPSGSYEVLVGAGGAGGGADGDEPGRGVNSEFNDTEATGGGVSDGETGALSGNGNAGEGYENKTAIFDEDYVSELYGGGGGGARGDAESWTGGPGKAFDRGDDAELFPENTGEFGKGGSVINETTAPELTPNSFNPANGVSSPLAGEGGSVKVNQLALLDGGYATSLDGEDGMVLLRWAGESDETDDESLPETGAETKPWTIAAAFASMAAGAAVLLRSRRRVNN